MFGISQDSQDAVETTVIYCKINLQYCIVLYVVYNSRNHINV